MIFMKRFALCSLTLASLLLLTACAGPSLVGTWTGTVSVQGANADVTVSFQQGGAMTTDMKIAGPANAEMAIKTTGTYKLEGEALTTTVDNVDLTMPPALKQMEAMIKDQIQKESAVSSGSIKWVDANTVELTPAQGNVLTLKRKV
jgi:hypothetical protein